MTQSEGAGIQTPEYRKSFSVAGPSIWNYLPKHARYQQQCFENSLKTHYFNIYCNIPLFFSVFNDSVMPMTVAGAARSTPGNK